MSNKIIYPILIIIFSLLIIYGILNRKKNNELNNNIEKFLNDSSKKKTNITDEDLLLDIVNNSIITKEFANGTWTSPSTTVDSNYVVSNLATINITGLMDINSTKDTIYGTINVMDNTYNITFILNENIVAVCNNNSNMSLHIKFFNIFTNEYRKTAYIESTLNSIVTIYVGTAISYKYYSYKVYNAKANGELYRAILTKDYYVVQPPEIYDYSTYDIIVGDYQYPPNIITLTYGVTNTSILDKLLSSYRDGIKFCIQRIYKSPTGGTITTKMSKPLLLPAIKNSTIIDNITVDSFAADRSINDFKTFFEPYQTILYFYKLINVDVTYTFTDPNYISVGSSTFNLNNNATNMYQPTVQFNNLNTVQQNNNSNYELTKVGNYEGDTVTSKITIPFSNLYNLL